MENLILIERRNACIIVTSDNPPGMLQYCIGSMEGETANSLIETEEEPDYYPEDTDFVKEMLNW